MLACRLPMTFTHLGQKYTPRLFVSNFVYVLLILPNITLNQICRFKKNKLAMMNQVPSLLHGL